MTLTLSQLSTALGKQTVLHDVSIACTKPELIGLIGPNGAGKSTLMRAIAGLQPFSGAMQFNGKPSTDYRADELAKLLAFLPQERIVHWPLIAYDVVMLGRMPHQSGFGKASAHDHEVVKAAMHTMEVASFAERPFDQLSGGEQARLLIARLLAQEPDIIIADEPINGLDPAHQIGLMRIFQTLVAEGKTVITSLHDLSLASYWCDRIVVLKEGQLIADGSPTDVLTAARIRDVYGVETAHLTLPQGSLVVPTDLADRK